MICLEALIAPSDGNGGMPKTKTPKSPVYITKKVYHLSTAMLGTWYNPLAGGWQGAFDDHTK